MFIDYELIITSKFLIKKLGFLSYSKNLNINLNDYYLYYINPNFFENIKNKKIFFFVGYNLRLESPILNIKLRKKKLKENLFYFLIGSNFNDNLNCKNIGLNVNNIIGYLNGKLKICNLVIKDIKKLKKNVENILDLHMFLLGNNIISRFDNKNIINLLKNKNKKLNFVTYLNKNTIISNYFINYSKVNLFYIFDKKYINININILYINLSIILYEEFNMFNNTHNINQISKNDIIYLLGINNLKLKKTKFCIFQGHHINLDYLNVDLIFPNITFFEKSNDYLNIEGNFLQTNFILYPPIFCRND
jgi:NADH-quinone oxidoreductase subunit G